MEVRFRGRNNEHTCYYCKKPINGDMVTNYYQIVACRLPVGEEAHSRCYSAKTVKDFIESDEKIEKMERIRRIIDSRTPDEVGNQ